MSEVDLEGPKVSTQGSFGRERMGLADRSYSFLLAVRSMITVPSITDTCVPCSVSPVADNEVILQPGEDLALSLDLTGGHQETGKDELC